MKKPNENYNFPVNSNKILKETLETHRFNETSTIEHYQKSFDQDKANICKAGSAKIDSLCRSRSRKNTL